MVWEQERGEGTEAALFLFPGAPTVVRLQYVPTLFRNQRPAPKRCRITAFIHHKAHTYIQETFPCTAQAKEICKKTVEKKLEAVAGSPSFMVTFLLLLTSFDLARKSPHGSWNGNTERERV